MFVLLVGGYWALPQMMHRALVCSAAKKTVKNAGMFGDLSAD
jgi:hypothetical protein